MRHLAVSNRKEVKRFVKFAIVGAAGTVTDLAIMNLVGQVFGAPFWLAITVGFSAAVIQNFTLNRIWTFPESHSRDARKQLVQFAIVSVIGLLINLAVALGIHQALEPFWITQFGEETGQLVSKNFAKVFAIGVVLFWNFTANRLWTYRGL